MTMLTTIPTSATRPFAWRTAVFLARLRRLINRFFAAGIARPQPPPAAGPRDPPARRPPRPSPTCRSPWLASGLPFVHEADKAHCLEGFRRAGLGQGGAAQNENVRRRPPLK